MVCERFCAITLIRIATVCIVDSDSANIHNGYVITNEGPSEKDRSVKIAMPSVRLFGSGNGFIYLRYGL